ncbi:MAG: hypothetical protein ABI972_20700 [Acidobacteriota bacterium]
MDTNIRSHLDAIQSSDKDAQGAAFQALMVAANVPVGWAYEAWDELVAALQHKNNHTRAIAAQVLCNLAKSDPRKKIVKDVKALLAVTKDERFVTARHCMQSLWKVGVAGDEQKAALMKGLSARFQECIAEKNCTLIRHDILESMRKVYEAAPDESIRKRAGELIATEEDAKYQKKYWALWKK